MGRKTVVLGLVAAFLCCAGRLAAAELDCPSPADSIPRGLHLRTSLGPAFWLGEIGTASRPGLAWGFAAGYDLWPFLALEALWTTGFHNTAQPSPPAAGSFATHALHGALRFGLPLGRFDLWVRGGAGMQWSTPDILVRVEGFDSRIRLGWLASLGFTWHTPRRHVWIGLEATALGALEFPGVLLLGSASLGWTF